MPIFWELYKNYSGAFSKGGESATMTVEEFVKLFEDAELINDAVNMWNAGVLVNQSLMTTIDEVNSNQHKQCWLIEFVEAFAWAADALSYPGDEQVGSSK